MSRHTAPHPLESLIAAAVSSLLVAAAVQAQGGSPAEALRAWNPELFAPGTLVDVAPDGAAGVRIVHATAALQALGFRAADHVVALQGRRLDSDDLPPRSGAAIFTVLRRAAPGERPVMTPDVLGLQALVQFTELPASARTPIRLARMVANQWTLVRDGLGVVLVPVAANERDSEWLRVANPLPEVAEAALREVADAFASRTSLGSGTPSEALAARRALDSGAYFEARERAARGIFRHITNPARRHDRSALDPQIEVFRRASRGVEAEQRALKAAGSRFGLFVQGAVHHVKESLPQNTLLVVDGANNVAVSAGLRTGLFWPSESGGWPLLRDLHLLTSYGYSRHTFHGPRETQVQEDISEPRLRTRLHRVSLELMYRPRVMSWLRPHLRGGPAFYHVTAGAYDSGDQLQDQVENPRFGWIIGGGVDAFYSPKHRVRLTVVADFQIVSPTQFCIDEAPNWEAATNLNPTQLADVKSELPLGYDCPTAGEDFGPFYQVDMDGFQVGLALAYEF